MNTTIDRGDIVVYLVPGIATLLLFLWLLSAGFEVAVPLTLDSASFGGALVVLVLGYCLGLVVQTFAIVWENLRERARGASLAALVLARSPEYSATFKRQLGECVQQVFGMPALAMDNSDKEALHRTTEIFGLCEALLLQEKSADQVRQAAELRAVYRGINSIGVISFGVNALIAFCQLLYLLPGGLSSLYAVLPFRDQTFQPYFQAFAFWMSVVLMLASTGVITWMASGTRRVRLEYVDAVYRGFFAWCAKRDMLTRESSHLMQDAVSSGTGPAEPA